MATRPVEPLLWLLFTAGGAIAALVMPVFVFLFGIAFPLGWLEAPSHGEFLALLAHPLARLGVFLFCVLALFHWAHRFRYTLYDGLQIKHLNELVNPLCYGGAVAGSVMAGYLLFVAL